MTNDNNWFYVSAAYGVTWLFMIGYWIRVHRLLRVARGHYEQASAVRPGGA